MTRVAHSPSKNLPHVPSKIANLDTGDLLCLEDGLQVRQLLATELFEMMRDGELEVVEVTEWRLDHWLVLDDGPVWVPLVDLPTWKEKRADELAREAESLRGDPLRVLSLVKAAAALRSLNLRSLLRDLRSKRESDDEGPAQVFSRVRGTQGAGRKS